jgi:hypothetical protein
MRRMLALAATGTLLAGCYNFNNPVDPLNATSSSDDGSGWQDIYVQDFDGVAPGRPAYDPVLDLDPDWAPPQDTSAVVADGPSGDRALLLTDSAVGGENSDRINLHKEITPVDGGRVRIEFHLSPVAPGAVWTFAEVLDGQSVVASVDLSVTRTLRYDADPLGGTIATGLTADEWYAVGFVLDLEQDEFSVLFEGDVHESRLGFLAPASDIDGLLFRTEYTGAVWIDDIRISRSQ